MFFRPRPPDSLFGAGIIFLSDEFSKPSSKCLGSRDADDFLETTEADLLGLGCKPAPLTIVESRPVAMNFFQHSDFYLEVFDNGLFALDGSSQPGKAE